MTDREQLFYDHAGWSFDPKRETSEQGRERCARELAAAEQALRTSEDLFVVWEYDDIDSSFFEDTDEPRPLFACLLCRDTNGEPDLTRGYSLHDGIFERPGNVVGSLGGIDLADEEPARSAYRRVVAAELMQEFTRQCETMVMRGEN